MFEDQQDLADAFKAGELECDFVAVMRFQGPRSNGMPELHKMTPFLGVLQFTFALKRSMVALWHWCAMAM